MGEQQVLASPRGEALVLGSTAALVWSALETWTTVAALEGHLAVAFPDVGPEERGGALDEILQLLDDEGLLERRSA